MALRGVIHLDYRDTFLADRLNDLAFSFRCYCTVLNGNVPEFVYIGKISCRNFGSSYLTVHLGICEGTVSEKDCYIVLGTS